MAHPYPLVNAASCRHCLHQVGRRLRWHRAHNLLPPWSAVLTSTTWRYRTGTTNTGELDIELLTKCSTTGLVHDVGRIPAAAASLCTRSVSTPVTTPMDAPAAPAPRLVDVLKQDQRTPTKYSILGSDAGPCDDKIATTSMLLRTMCTAVLVPSQSLPFTVLQAFAVPKLDVPAHTTCVTKCSGSNTSGI